MDTAQINFNIIDQSYSPDPGIQGVSGYLGVFKRGPIGNAGEIFGSWNRFKKVYGGLIPTSDDPLIVKRMLDVGSKVRVCGIGHFATISDPSTLSATASVNPNSGFEDASAHVLFNLVPKYKGAYNLVISILAPSNGQANYFNLQIALADEPDYTPELYTNLLIPGTPTIATSNYLIDVVNGSELVNVVYSDLSALTAPIKPVTIVETYTPGTAGGAIVDTDYIGDAGGANGLHAFDTVGDIYAIGSSHASDAYAVGGAAYAAHRADLQFFYHFANSYTTTSQITANKDSLNIDTPFVEFWCGGLKVLDPLSNLIKPISAIGDILAAAANSEANFGAYRSFAGSNRGIISNAMGVVNNFGSNADLTNLNILSNKQINAVINIDNAIELSGNFSGQLATSHLSFNNVVRLVIFIQRSLRPLCKNFMEEPNDIPTWKQIYLSCKPFMDSLISKRAIFDYAWQGDQFVNSITDIVINDATDIGLGKYLVVLSVKDITSLREFNINIVITQSNVTFN